VVVVVIVVVVVVVLVLVVADTTAAAAALLVFLLCYIFEAADELERVRNQLVQERQLRAVTEACLMEDRVAWQRVSAVVSETLQHCAILRDGLSATRYDFFVQT